MRQSSEHLRQLSAITATLVADRIITFLKRKYPRATADCVASDTGLARATIAKWFERTSAPNAPALLTLMAVYRLELLDVLLPDAEWIKVVALAVERDTLERQMLKNDRAQEELNARRRAAR